MYSGILIIPMGYYEKRFAEEAKELQNLEQEEQQKSTQCSVEKE
jgi:hypothetical protein